MNRDHSALLLVSEHINDSRRVIGLPRTDLASTYFQYDSMPDISTNLPAIREITRSKRVGCCGISDSIDTVTAEARACLV